MARSRRFITSLARSFGMETSAMRRGRTSRVRGLSNERRVMERFRNKGWLVKPSRASRGPYDFYAMRRGRKMFVQVKSGNSRFTETDRTRLKSIAQKKGGSAMLYRIRHGKQEPQFV